MKRLVLGSMKILVIILILLFPFQTRADQALCSIANSALKDAEQIRGLKRKKEIPCKVQNIDEVKKFLLKTITEKTPTQKMEMEEFVFKTLGMLPEDFDYKKGLIDFYASQAGGYYNPEKKEFVMAAWMPGMLQTTVAVHELTHALQDQYYDLEAFTDLEKFTTDELLARSALIEGDATAVMTDYTRRLLGQKGIANDKNVDGVMLQNAIGFSVMAGNVSVPRGLQMLLFFPYTSGLRFVHQVLNRSGYKGLDSVFNRVPLSTREILHPEDYFQRKEWRGDFSMDLLLEKRGKKKEALLYRDVLGEFFISVLLQSLGENGAKAAQSAAGWKSDHLLVFSEATGKKEVFWVIEWDTVPDLKEFYASYSAGLKRRQKKASYSFDFEEEAKKLSVLFRQE